MKLSTVIASAIASTGALAAPSAVSSKREALIYPSGTYRYWVQSGEIIADPQDQLLVVKDGVLEHATTAIVTFDPKPENADKTCRLIFDLWDRDVSTGSETADVFTVIDPPASFSTTQKVADMRPCCSRDEHKGRIHAPVPGRAEWIQSYDGYPEFPCPTEEVMAIEFVGVGDDVTIRWDIGVTGPRVEIVE